jgi:hypothetical protein
MPTAVPYWGRRNAAREVLESLVCCSPGTAAAFDPPPFGFAGRVAVGTLIISIVSVLVSVGIVR